MDDPGAGGPGADGDVRAAAGRGVHPHRAGGAERAHHRPAVRGHAGAGQRVGGTGP